MTRIPELMKGKKKAIAWVVGLGGASEHFPESPTEHIEVAEMLRLAGVKDYKVYAIDNRKEAIEAAKKDLEKGKIQSPIKDGKLMVGMVEGGVSRTDSGYTEKPRFMEYHDWFFEKGKEFDLSELRKKIVPLHIKPTEENAMLETPAERPDLIISFNTAVYAHDQTEFAKTLCDALQSGGFLLTVNVMEEAWFRTELKKQLKCEKPIEVGPHFTQGCVGYNVYSKPK